jgi:hypothetical protein
LVEKNLLSATGGGKSGHIFSCGKQKVEQGFTFLVAAGIYALFTNTFLPKEESCHQIPTRFPCHKKQPYD